jgi:hypothetical protein
MTELQWKPVIYLPANLTIEFGTSVLAAADPAPWCRQKASEVLGPAANRRQVDRLTRCLEEYAENFRSEPLPAYAALFFYPDFGHLPPRAMTKIHLVGPDPVIGPMTLDRAREIFGPDDYSFGETEMTETSVPVGPALRVHRFRTADPAPAKKRTAIVEELAWVICPPDSSQAVMMSTKWGEPAFSPAAVTIADDMAKNFRIEPAR